MKVTDVQLYPVVVDVVPITAGGIAPYVGSRDAAGTSQVTSAIYKVETDTGLVGWGEMNLILSLGITRALLEDFIKPAVIGRSPFDLNAIRKALTSLYNPDIYALHFFSGVEMALWDLMGKEAGLPIYAMLGGALRDRIEIAYAMGWMDDATTAIKVKQVVAQGYRCIKTKGGFDVAADIRRAEIMRETAPGLRLRVDMNQGYSFAEAVQYARGVEPYALEYVEQPIEAGHPEEFAMLRKRSSTPIAANEDCYIPGGLQRFLRHNALDAGVVDLESAGGIAETVALAACARAGGLPLAHHCAWDMGIKTAAILHVCAALPAFTLAMDSTYPNHAADVLVNRHVVREGHYELPKGPGLGIVVCEASLSRCACAEPDRKFVF